MNKRLIQIDHDTGEVVDGFVAYVVPKRKNGFQQGWLAMAQNGAEILAQSDLGANDFKVLMKLLSVLDYENLIQVSQADIARELDMHRQHVQRSIKRLIQLGIILEGVKIGISRSYRLNPSFGWKGSAKGHREVLARALEGYQVIRGRRAHGAALATLATCAHLSPDNQAGYTTQSLRDSIVPGRGALAPLTPKTLKMSAYGTLSSTARPQGSCQTPWALPTPAFATWQGCRGKPPAPLPQSVGSPPTCKGQAASGCFASLDRFPAPSASIVLLLTEVERGQGRRSRAFYPLTPWSRPNTSPQGQVVGF